MDWQPCKKPQHLRAKTANGKARGPWLFFAPRFEVPRCLTNFPGVPFVSLVLARHGSLQKACQFFIGLFTFFVLFYICNIFEYDKVGPKGFSFWAGVSW